MKKQKQAGFALLISLIVVSVVISVGLTVLDLSITQVRLSDNAKQSELAFHAANAGVECGRYWRREASADMEAGLTINPTCFGVTDSASDSGISGGNNAGEIENGTAYKYVYEFTWGTAPDLRCTRISTIVITNAGSGGATLHDVDDSSLIPGFPETDIECEEGEQCTVMAVRGYNKSCANTGSFGTTEREVLLQF